MNEKTEILRLRPQNDIMTQPPQGRGGALILSSYWGKKKIGSLSPSRERVRGH